MARGGHFRPSKIPYLDENLPRHYMLARKLSAQSDDCFGIYHPRAEAQKADLHLSRLRGNKRHEWGYTQRVIHK